MTDTVSGWLAALESAYPAATAEAWDSVGLQVGDPTAAVEAVLVALDVTSAVLDEAAGIGAGLVLTHHPLLFRPLERLTPATAAGRLALQAAAARIAVAAAHTNFDAAADGTTEPLERLLGIVDAKPLSASRAGTDFAKLVVFAPVEATAAVMAAAFGAGGGGIGEYDECSFRVTGTGTFRPSATANPAVGQRERRNDVAEDRIEIVVAQDRAATVASAVIAAHPYEEVALDVYPLLGIGQQPAATRGGLGRVGNLAEPLTVGEAAHRLRDGLPSPLLRFTGDPDRVVRRVAACGGAGDSLIPAALAAGAELYVTGDLRHHVTLDAMTMGMALIDAGHHATESAALPALLAALERAGRQRGLQARLLPSSVSTEPWWSGADEEDQRR